jgi:hypothetical protein
VSVLVIGMEGTEVAVIAYAPKGWPTGLSCLARRTRIRADAVSADPRARKRRTIPTEQLALALDGDVEFVYGYSFILTNLPVHTPESGYLSTDLDDCHGTGTAFCCMAGKPVRWQSLRET